MKMTSTDWSANMFISQTSATMSGFLAGSMSTSVTRAPMRRPINSDTSPPAPTLSTTFFSEDGILETTSFSHS